MLHVAKIFRKKYLRQFKDTIRAEDFEQFCLETMLRRKHSKIIYKYMIIDWVRRFEGPKPREIPMEEISVVSQPRELNVRGPLQLRTLDIGILNLSIVWGFTGAEIARIFNVHNSYVTVRQRIMLQKYSEKID